MVNGKVLALLKEITLQDCQYEHQYVKKIAHAGDYQQQATIYSDQGNYYFKVIGSPYLLAMVKWLSIQLQAKQKASLETLDIANLQQMFDLPTHKRQDALLILQLIEQLQ